MADIKHIKLRLHPEGNLEHRNLKQFLDACTEQGHGNQSRWIAHALINYLRHFEAMAPSQIPTDMLQVHHWLRNAVANGEIVFSEQDAHYPKSVSNQDTETADSLPDEPGQRTLSQAPVSAATEPQSRKDEPTPEATAQPDEVRTQASPPDEPNEANSDQTPNSEWFNRWANVM